MIRTIRWAALSSILALSACSDPALQQKVTDLEAKVAALEEKVANAPAAKAGPSADEQAAMQLFKDASEAARSGNRDAALAKLKELQTKHKGSRAAGAGARLQAELSVVGKKIDELKTEEWFIGQAGLADSKATMLVFWEVWCPHCKREVPKLQQTFDKYKDQGFGLIGLTKLTRGKTPEEVKAFLDENKVSYPVAKEAGDMSQFFGVSGVPAAAVVKNGEVVWRGHPAQVNDQMISDWIN